MVTEFETATFTRREEYREAVKQKDPRTIRSSEMPHAEFSPEATFAPDGETIDDLFARIRVAVRPRRYPAGLADTRVFPEYRLGLARTPPNGRCTPSVAWPADAR